MQKVLFFHISVSQLACLLAKSRRYFFIAWVKRGFRAGLQDLRPNSRENLCWIVWALSTVPISINLACIFFGGTHGIVNNHLTHNTASLLLEILGRSDHFLSLNMPSFWFFMTALCTDVLLTFISFPIWCAENFKLLKVTIWGRFPTLRDVFAHFLNPRI